jgi:hypothetical protein
MEISKKSSQAIPSSWFRFREYTYGQRQDPRSRKTFSGPGTSMYGRTADDGFGWTRLFFHLSSIIRVGQLLILKGVCED